MPITTLHPRGIYSLGLQEAFFFSLKMRLALLQTLLWIYFTAQKVQILEINKV